MLKRHGYQGREFTGTLVKGAKWKHSIVKPYCKATETLDAKVTVGRDREASADIDLANYVVSESIIARNKVLAEELRGELILGPLTKGGNLPFRQLCVEFGARVTMSEMSYAKILIKGDKVERARLYKAANETCFGFQIATKTISDGIQASRIAHEAGARWLDINFGCPIYEASRRGLGAIQLRKPAKLAKMVAGIVAESPIPVTVKIRIGETDKKLIAPELTELFEKVGVAAVSIHGRTMEQRYTRAADWELIQQIALERSVPVIGNGDVLTLYEVQRRQQGSQCLAIMAARGALIKPWIFQEFREGRELNPTSTERVAIYRQLVLLMKRHFGDDAMGRRKAWYFLPWHFGFLCRYRHFPAAVYGAQSMEHPLINTRTSLVDEKLGEDEQTLPRLERLLRCTSLAAHEAIASALWDSTSDADAVSALMRLSENELAVWEAEVQSGSRDGRDREDEAQG